MLCAFASQTDYLLLDAQFPFYLLYNFHPFILKTALSGICSSSTEKCLSVLTEVLQQVIGFSLGEQPEGQATQAVLAT